MKKPTITIQRSMNGIQDDCYVEKHNSYKTTASMQSSSSSLTSSSLTSSSSPSLPPQLLAPLPPSSNSNINNSSNNDNMNKPGSKKPISKDDYFRSGRWTKEEKLLFLHGLNEFGKGKWKKIGTLLPTRSLVQIKSHAQKVMKRLEAGDDIMTPLKENHDYFDTVVLPTALLKSNKFGLKTLKTKNNKVVLEPSTTQQQCTPSSLTKNHPSASSSSSSLTSSKKRNHSKITTATTTANKTNTKNKRCKSVMPPRPTAPTSYNLNEEEKKTPPSLQQQSQCEGQSSQSPIDLVDAVAVPPPPPTKRYVSNEQPQLHQEQEQQDHRHHNNNECPPSLSEEKPASSNPTSPSRSYTFSKIRPLAGPPTTPPRSPFRRQKVASSPQGDISVGGSPNRSAFQGTFGGGIKFSFQHSRPTNSPQQRQQRTQHHHQPQQLRDGVQPERQYSTINRGSDGRFIYHDGSFVSATAQHPNVGYETDSTADSSSTKSSSYSLSSCRSPPRSSIQDTTTTSSSTTTAATTAKSTTSKDSSSNTSQGAALAAAALCALSGVAMKETTKPIIVSP